ncbi:MAG: hypothetical protein GF384_06245, partial [Elusimicrobia bacterium]|nr:hypothetical protein [Elusimicrobiota bacterium]
KKPSYQCAPWEQSLLRDNLPGEYMYFVHSYYVIPKSPKIIISETTYEDITYCSSVAQGSVFACQFHPERSAHKGLMIYKLFNHYIRSHYATGN